MRQTVKEIMDGIKYDSVKKTDNNTVEYTTEGIRKIRLHNTDILTFHSNGDITVNSGGWQTLTTKDRLNKYLPYGYRISQTKGIWYLNDIPFRDGITIKKNGKIIGGGNLKKTMDCDRRIKEYVNGFMSALEKREIPPPSSGDCWYCAMKDANTGKLLGDIVGSDHIQQHIKENYYVPSLLVNAIKENNVSPIARHYLGYSMKMHNESVEWGKDVAIQQVKRALTNYIRRHSRTTEGV